MAFELPKINFSDAKTRVFLIVGGIAGFIGIIYLLVNFLSSGTTITGSSKVANAPGNLQSVPGGTLTPEYYKALVQANKQAAKQAQISGGSAVPTLLNEPGAQASFDQPANASCTVVCPNEDNVNVQNDLDDLVKAGKITPEDAKRLGDLAAQDVGVSEYSAALNNMVKSGKLTSEQARKLLEDYKKQHQNKMVEEGAKAMDALIKSGKIPLATANELLDMQKRQVSTDEYATKLNQLVKEGKISSATAAALLAQYTQQHAKEAAKELKGQLAEMAESGQIAPDVAKELASYQERHVSQKEYEEELQHLVKQGKLTQEQADHLLAQYKQQIPPDVAKQLADMQRSNVGVQEYQAELQRLVKEGKISTEQAQALLEQYTKVRAKPGEVSTMDDIIKQAEKANQDRVHDLAASGKISAETAAEILRMEQAKVPVDEYKRHLDDLERQGKIDHLDAQKLLISYMQQKGAGVQDLLDSGKITRETAQKLVSLQQANASVADYKRQLDQLVSEGKLSQEDAQKLLSNYTLLKEAKDSVNGLNGLVQDGKISKETAAKIADLQKAAVPVEEYQKQLDQLVREGKISAADAQKLVMQYMQEKGGGVQDLLRQGKITADTAQKLMQLQQAGVASSEYKRQLDQLVREGKLSSADAEKLLANYQIMKAAGVQEMLAAGKITAPVAQELLALQQSNASVADYKRKLDRLVREGKISQEDANELLSRYQQAKGGGATVQEMLAAGKITAPVAQELLALQQSNASVADYKRKLDQLVREGKISQEDANALLSQYQQAKGGGATVQELLGAAKLSPEAQQKLLAMQQSNVNVEDYKRQLDEAVKTGAITKTDADALLHEYEKLHAVRAEAERLASMRSANASIDEYANELKRAVEAGTLTPEQAANLLQEYREAQTKTAVVTTTAAVPNVKGSEEFIELQKKVQANAPKTPPPGPKVSKEQFSAAAAKERARLEQEEQQRIAAIASAMQNQAGQLISSWQPPTMGGMATNPTATTTETTKTDKDKKGQGSSSSSSKDETTGAAGGAGPIIKAGTILYAVLDTAVNSDFPDSPVLATIVDGKYKGAKLLGKVSVTKDQDKVTLSFKLMDMDDWTSGKTVTAFAIDPDTARSALASNVNYHYFVRYGALFASSFLTGYAQAINNSGSTTSSGVFGTTTARPSYSPSAKIMTGLGQVGTTFGAAVQGYTTTPPTVKIDPGVSLGILFMSDVSG